MELTNEQKEKLREEYFSLSADVSILEWFLSKLSELQPKAVGVSDEEIDIMLLKFRETWQFRTGNKDSVFVVGAKWMRLKLIARAKEGLVSIKAY